MTTYLEQRAREYAFSTDDAADLKGAVLLPLDVRKQLLTMYGDKHGDAALVNLFAQFIGLANSVIENANESLWLLGITKGGLSEREAEQINTPTLFGALQGVELAARVDQSKTCQGCAFRLGTLANQSPSTTSDVHWCLGDDDRFMCHEHLDAGGTPNTLCVGYQQVMKRKARYQGDEDAR